MRNYKLERRN